ncbi:MAG: hypothetical protein OSB58_01200 [Alphaproteobacteria bacterium]|jgi:hypothetical protein|nr:hypothetical protein [Alphaproteobacteria bacterium]
MSDLEQARSEIDGLLEELLDRYDLRIRAAHNRARSDAGPSLMGGMRSFDHYTYNYVREAGDDCLRDASMVLLEYAGEQGVEPGTLVAEAKICLAKHFQGIKDYLYDDINQPPAHEYGMRPSRESLAEVSRYLDERLAGAMTSLGRGRLDERLRPNNSVITSLIGPLLQRIGGGHKVALVLVAVLLIWALVSGL